MDIEEIFNTLVQDSPELQESEHTDLIDQYRALEVELIAKGVAGIFTGPAAEEAQKLAFQGDFEGAKLASYQGATAMLHVFAQEISQIVMALLEETGDLESLKEAILCTSPKAPRVEVESSTKAKAAGQLSVFDRDINDLYDALVDKGKELGFL